MHDKNCKSCTAEWVWPIDPVRRAARRGCRARRRRKRRRGVAKRNWCYHFNRLLIELLAEMSVCENKVCACACVRVSGCLSVCTRSIRLPFVADFPTRFLLFSSLEIGFIFKHKCERGYMCCLARGTSAILSRKKQASVFPFDLPFQQKSGIRKTKVGIGNTSHLDRAATSRHSRLSLCTLRLTNVRLFLITLQNLTLW